MPFAGHGSRAERAQRALPLFDAQLRFAAVLADLRGESFAHGVTHYTNFHRRFGYGRLHGGTPAAGWVAFIEAVCAAPDAAARLAVTAEHFARGTEEPLGGQAVFGCFSYNPPDAGGVVRIHFLDRDSADGVGPLARGKQSRRRDELTRMIGDLVRHHPDARVIRGRSWLYHREAYRRLFPPEYVAQPREVDSNLHFSGSGCWGQFQRAGGVDEEACRQFVARLDELDAERPWRILPCIPLEVEAPIACFVEHYGVE